jgi:hypothetical protein
MLIEWLIPIRTTDLLHLGNSNLASIRLRTAVGAAAAEQAGMRNQFTDGFDAPHPDVVIVGKIDITSDPMRLHRWIDRLRTISKKSRTAIVIDYTDHHLIRNTDLSAFYNRALEFASHLVCSSRILQRGLSSYYSGPISVIGDPIEVPILSPVEKNNSIPTAMWFGHASNLPYLIDFLRDNYRHKEPARLIAMTNLYPLPKQISELMSGDHLRNLEINVIPWSREDMIKVSTIADVCWIPAGVDDPRKNGASANRLLTALALGLPTAAGALDSYSYLKDHFVNLPSSEVYEQLEYPHGYFDVTKAAQIRIQSENCFEAIGEEWLSFIYWLAESFSSTTVDKKTNHEIFDRCKAV